MKQGTKRTKSLLNLPAVWPRRIRALLIVDCILALLFFLIDPAIALKNHCSSYDPLTLDKYIAFSIMPALLCIMTAFFQLRSVKKLNNQKSDSFEKDLHSINRRQNILLVLNICLIILYYSVLNFTLCAVIDDGPTTAWDRWRTSIMLTDHLTGLFAFFILPIVIKIGIHMTRKELNLPTKNRASSVKK